LRRVVLHPHRDSVLLNHQDPVSGVLTSGGRPDLLQAAPDGPGELIEVGGGEVADGALDQ
ncbi:hypothetical protein ACIA8O_12270, partial [Kitasatospora sp. NPDC051853]|uniref:hypothetical protein n=1 Tax=Kitasatospora sp. NPDC051853 TaxID=3364058 RepID=UPI0037B60CE5